MHSTQRIQVGVFGATGYTGLELLKILVRHPRVQIKKLFSESLAGTKLSEYAPFFKGKCDRVLESFDAHLCAHECEALFFATPHGVTMQYAKLLYDSAVKMIDLSGDYRLSSEEYAQYYGMPHADSASLQYWVYGLSEYFQEEIRRASYVANPGCYPMSVLLALLPAYRRYSPEKILCDVKSGVSGRGKKLSEGSLFVECNENVYAYKLSDHQHAPEIEMAIHKHTGTHERIVFTPHLIPMNRGILATIYLLLQNIDLDEEELRQHYRQSYAQSPFVKILNKGILPQTKNVAHTNECHINFSFDRKSQVLKIISVIDNLIKGAAGTAVQNFNLMHNLQESAAFD